MAIDITLSTKTNNTISVPVNVPSGVTPSVTFRNADAPTNSLSGGVLSITIPANQALKYDGIDFFIRGDNNGVNLLLLHGRFTTPVDPDRNAKISDVTAAVSGINVGDSFAPTQGIVYNANGDVTSVTEGGVTTTYTYNANGTVNTETRNGKVRTWSYDANGNPTGSVVA